ncbi:hypothetical protein MtrunA17_Chr5g0414411 [Medicago truncatula]|uniref:Transmembrane protein n=1 Tax=Medicago truncatula TaxID=3880 RepID=A0A396HRN0_MEDTR|nr:hypothetical protein MtrunA17_Chr5g0414411 [Medicago truncatula]
MMIHFIASHPDWILKLTNIYECTFLMLHDTTCNKLAFAVIQSTSTSYQRHVRGYKILIMYVIRYMFNSISLTFYLL